MTIPYHWSEMDQKFWINDGDDVLWFESVLELKDAIRQIELRNAADDATRQVVNFASGWMGDIEYAQFKHAVEAGRYTQ